MKSGSKRGLERMEYTQRFRLESGYIENSYSYA
jgi:hypothetical protein